MAVKTIYELIPDNATNGDVIKALFPQLECDYWCPRFADNWWNAPYKAEKSEGGVDNGSKDNI